MSSVYVNKADTLIVPVLTGVQLRGVYSLVIYVPRVLDIDVGSLGHIQFSKGYYLYTGSAVGKGSSSLNGRIARHLRLIKKFRWHIDYLVSAGHGNVTNVILSEAGRRSECSVNKALIASFRAPRVIRGFGSSDCVERCGGHLLYLGDGENDRILPTTLETYALLRLSPKVVDAWRLYSTRDGITLNFGQS